MATIQSTMALNDRMSSTLSSIVKAMHSTLSAMQSVEKQNGNMGKAFQKAQQNVIQAEKQLKQFDSQINKTNSTMNKGTSTANSFFKGLLGAQAVQKVFGMVTSQVGSAIQRFDTLNNYVNVMSNLGIEADEAQKSIDRMKDALDGLPTTLQDGASAVQRFASSNKNVEASTEMFLALNNAILAGGGSAATQAAALEQLSQSYAKGKPDMMEWRTALTAMPAQLDQVAKAMDMANATELGESLRSGKTSMDDFMKTLVRMNNESVNGFKTLDEQARNATGGIQTSLTNFKTAITKGLTDMIENINNSLQASGLPTIQVMIQKAGVAIKNVLSSVGKAIGEMMTVLAPILQTISNIFTFVSDNAGIITAAIGMIVLALGVYKGYLLAVKIATMAWTAVQWILNGALLANPIGLIILAVVALIGIIYAVVNAINQTTGSTISATGVIMGVLYTLGAFVWNVIIVPIWNGFAALVNFIANCFKNPVASIKILFYDMCLNVLNNVKGLIQGLQDLINLIPGVNVNLTGGISNLISSVGAKKAEEIKNSGYTEVVQRLETKDYGEAYKAGYNKGSNFGSGLKKATSSASTTDWQKAMEGLNNNVAGTTGTDKSGGKAVKTTTEDNLFSDEDIKLLLDVATRDYKLNYQQITPNVTVTFGDVRETADVDDILDQVADRLEEIYDGSLEVG